MTDVELICKAAKENSAYIAKMKNDDRNKMLRIVAESVKKGAKDILRANNEDIRANADKPEHMLDRLRLDEKRIDGIAEGLNQLCGLVSPVGEIIDEWTVKSGLHIKKVRVPLGVVAII